VMDNWSYPVTPKIG